MRLILLRHAEAVDRAGWTGEDSERPLTKAGAQRANDVLKLCRPLIKAVEIWTSPWTRARATAELASQIWQLPLREMPWMAGGAAGAAERSRQLRPSLDVVLVGHEPDLGELGGFLCGGKPLPLSKGGLAVLKGEPIPGGMVVRTLIAAKQVLALGGKG